MVLKIEKDHQRFRQIVKGRIREDLRKFLTKGELIGKEGKHLISIPVRGIELPHFRYGDNSQGVGAGDGKARKFPITLVAQQVISKKYL